MAEHGTIVGAPELSDEHLPVFDVAVGARAISHAGHIKMMGAVQPFLSGAISKTVNMPQTATVEDIAEAYIAGLEARRQGAGDLPRRLQDRAGAAHRRAGGQGGQGEGRGGDLRRRGGVHRRRGRGADRGGGRATPLKQAATSDAPARKRMPRERKSLTHKFSLGGHEGYITAGMYDDGTVGEIFLTDIGKEGSTLRGMMNSFATAISIALQYGVPLETLVQQVRLHALRAGGDHHQPGDPVREVDARLHHALARLALPGRRRPGGARHPHARGARQKTAEDIAAGAAGGSAGPDQRRRPAAARPRTRSRPRRR